MLKRIVVNGREYASVEEMPPDVRRQYERAMGMLADREGSGVPNIFESGKTRISSEPGQPMVSVSRSSRYIVNGVEYQRWEDIPPDVQQMLRQAGGGPKSLANAAADPTAARQGFSGAKPGLTFSRTFSTSRRWDAPNRPDGITIRLSWSTLLALLAAILATAVVGWVMLR